VYGTVHIGPLPLGNLLTGSSNLVLQKEYIWALLRIEPENQTACLASSPISASAYRYVYLKKSNIEDLDSLVRGMDPDPALDPDPSIIMQ
jgi:hypothetical protein